MSAGGGTGLLGFASGVIPVSGMLVSGMPPSPLCCGSLAQAATAASATVTIAAGTVMRTSVLRVFILSPGLSEQSELPGDLRIVAGDRRRVGALVEEPQ